MQHESDGKKVLRYVERALSRPRSRRPQQRAETDRSHLTCAGTLQLATTAACEPRAAALRPVGRCKRNQQPQRFQQPTTRASPSRPKLPQTFTRPAHTTSIPTRPIRPSRALSPNCPRARSSRAHATARGPRHTLPSSRNRQRRRRHHACSPPPSSSRQPRRPDPVAQHGHSKCIAAVTHTQAELYKQRRRLRLSEETDKKAFHVNSKSRFGGPGRRSALRRCRVAASSAA
jgi:hypothetical protein